MTHRYEFTVKAVLVVDADDVMAAHAKAQEMAEEFNADLPLDITLIRKNGEVEVCFDRQL